MPPRRPVDRYDELRLVEGLIACEGRSQGRSFLSFCGKFWLFPHRLRGRACLGPFQIVTVVCLFSAMNLPSYGMHVVCFVERHEPDGVLLP